MNIFKTFRVLWWADVKSVWAKPSTGIAATLREQIKEIVAGLGAFLVLPLVLLVIAVATIVATLLLAWDVLKDPRAAVIQAEKELA